MLTRPSPMILEGIVTSMSALGEINVAPMGPYVDAEMSRLVFRPYKTAQTFRNLKEHGEGVFHVTDDVLLLARTALGCLSPMPLLFPARKIRGQVLQESCRFYEFRVCSLDEREERTRIEVEVVHCERLRDFFGFNRGKHAIVEAAILATRVDFLSFDEIQSEFRKLAVLVEKTGGDQERHAFAFLQDFLARVSPTRATDLRTEDPRE
jgi:hypothetical protein